jgi:cold-inducible RNA-binding protein
VKKLYIGNLPFSATDEQLQEWFSQIGVTPSGVNLIRDRFTGQSRGFAFVEVNNDEDADRAINSLNGQNFGGRNLVVNEARPQAERAGGGGGGGRVGHGGGGGGGGRGGDRGGGDRGDRGNRW